MMKNIIMKKFNFILLTAFCLTLLNPTFTPATMIEGGINTNEQAKNYCTVIDKSTRKPVSNARIRIPSTNYTVYSDINGHFELKTVINNQTILSVEKQNYKPFSMTLKRGANRVPFIVEIESSTPLDIGIETRLCHLGDNNYSNFSANAGQFMGAAVGPVYSQKFFIPASANTKQQYLVIGSIVGIDTAMARGMGQNQITTSFASPPAVYFNGQKIAEIQINGDNQRIKLPKHLVKYNQNNIITIKAGRNLMQTAYVDYDDIEFMNLSIQSVSISNGQQVSRR